MSDPYYNPEEELSKTRDNLPHWEQEGKLCFITWRLADSLPQSKLEEFKTIKKQWLELGTGACVLKHSGARKIVTDKLQELSAENAFTLEAYVIMPNHVHLLVALSGVLSLPQIMQRLKGGTARSINQLMKSEGSVWQRDYYDTLIRGPKHKAFVIGYIEKNPVRLPHNQYSLWIKPQTEELEDTERGL